MERDSYVGSLCVTGVHDDSKGDEEGHPGAGAAAVDEEEEEEEGASNSNSNNNNNNNNSEAREEGLEQAAVENNNSNLIATATAVTIDELEYHVTRRILEGAPVAEIVRVVDKTSDDRRRRRRRQRQRCRWVLLVVGAVFVVLLAIVVPSILLQRGNDNDNDSDNDNDNDNNLDNTSPPTEMPHDFVYVINMAMDDFCGHETNRANRCGGHLASITTPKEKALVDALKDIAFEKAQNQIPGVWMGGQRIPFRTDTEELIWAWSDFSTWFQGGDDDASSYWAPGHPNHTRYDTGDNNNETLLLPQHPYHHVLLTQSGEYTDQNGCDGNGSPKGPAIYLLPNEYRTEEDYPDCDTSLFLQSYETPLLPPRPNPEWVYVIRQWYYVTCFVDAAPGLCGGYAASITTPREKAIVDLLKDMAIQHAKDEHGKTNVDGVWLGANQVQGQNDTGQQEVNVTWEWLDGSPWFDNDGAYWAEGQPDNVIHPKAYTDDVGVFLSRGEHAIILNENGKYQDELDCSFSAAAKRLPAIFRLPFDYSNRTKYPDCAMGQFTIVVPAPPRR